MDALQSLKNFGQSFEKVLGTDETVELLDKLSAFATQCPETVIELRQVVLDNPEVFKDLLTPQGVADAKKTIETVKTYLPFL